MTDIKDSLKAFNNHLKAILNFRDSIALVKYEYQILNVIFIGLPEEEQEKLTETMEAIDKMIYRYERDNDDTDYDTDDDSDNDNDSDNNSDNDSDSDNDD